MFSIVCFWGMAFGAMILLIIGIQRGSKALIKAGVASLLLLGVFIGLGFLAVRSVFPPPTTNLRQYTKLIGEAGSSPLLAHFPRKIPADARNVHMYYNPGPLQAATILQLRYTTTPKQIAILTARFTPKAVQIMTGGDDDLFTMKPSFFTEDNVKDSHDTGLGSFPSDFQILVLYRDQAQTADPTYSGVAISKKRNEIVYWMEY